MQNNVLHSDIKPVARTGVKFNDVSVSDETIKRHVLNTAQRDQIKALQSMNRASRRAIGKQFHVKIRGVDTSIRSVDKVK